MAPFRRAALYWNTVRHLRVEQICARILRHFPVRMVHPSTSMPLVRPVVWVKPYARAVSMVGRNHFLLLNEEGALAGTGWQAEGRAALWRYNLHYFDDLNAIDASDRSEWHRNLLEHWVRENPLGKGVGWAPYPTSLRIVNWIKWHWNGNSLSPMCQDSLAAQLRWLSSHLEWHLLGNHLFANAKALVFGGLAFEGREAISWLSKGLSVIRSQLDEQLLADNGNFELSPMYHALFAEDLLDLINAARAYDGSVPQAMASAWRVKAVGMLDWLIDMSHPDGDISFFNDAAPDVAPTAVELSDYAERLGLRPRREPHEGNPNSVRVSHMVDSGYVRMEIGPAVAILDVAKIGPDYLPGHGHADCLSFELSVHGRRCIVNGGTSTYEAGLQRNHERSTAAHSTVEVDGESSSEVWGSFRVARRARPIGPEIEMRGSRAEVTAAHDGYLRLPSRTLHRRSWRLDADGLSVLDTLEGQPRNAVARFLFHPEVRVGPMEDNGCTVFMEGTPPVRMTVARGLARIEGATYALGFGKMVPTYCLAVTAEGGAAVTTITW